MSYATTHIHDYSIRFYKTLEEETGLNAGFAVVGNLRMAQTDERMDEYMLYATTAETAGRAVHHFMTPEEIKDDVAADAHRRSQGRTVPPDGRLY